MGDIKCKRCWSTYDWSMSSSWGICQRCHEERSAEIILALVTIMLIVCVVIIVIVALYLYNVT